jgi:hypothetical protein
MTIKKIRLKPFRLPGLMARGRHGDGRKIVFNPTRAESGGLELRGEGYDVTVPADKVWGKPTRGDDGLEFRSVTDTPPVPCVVCWECNPGITNPREDLIIRGGVDVLLDNFPGGDGCCQLEFGNVRYSLAACDEPGEITDFCSDFPAAGNCSSFPASGMIQAAYWFGEFTGYYNFCGTEHPGIQWVMKMILRTFCKEDMDPENYWATLQMKVSYIPGGTPFPPLCCARLGGLPDEGEGLCSLWECCWPITETELCGDFYSSTAALCCCDAPEAYPCDCIDVYVLEPL